MRNPIDVFRALAGLRLHATGWTACCVAVTCLLALACGGSDARDQVTEDECLNDFFEEVFERRVAESPERESALGRRTDQQGRWDDRSDRAAAARIDRVRRDLERLREEFDRDALSEQSRLSYDLFAFDAERRIEAHEFGDHHYVVDQFNGQLSGLLTVLQNHHAVESEADAFTYIQRLESLEGVLSGMAERLEGRAAIGVIPPAFAFPAVIADARAMSGVGTAPGSARENPLWIDFSNKLGQLESLSDSSRERLLQSGEAALRGPFRRGFARLIETLERMQPAAERNGDRGVWSLPRGDAYYANRIRHHTTLELTADEVHELGLREVDRLHEEMRALQNVVGVEGDLSDFFEFVRTDPNNFYEDSDEGREQFLTEARDKVDAIFAVVGDWFGRLPKAELEVRRVEPWRENSVSIAFYSRPSQDGSRPGVYYANLADMSQLQKYVFTAITYHESVPGHHFQIALAQEMNDLPKFRRFGGFGAYTEGWALYAEKLAKEMGFYQEPLHDFGRLQNELWRAARLVIDTGIHAKRWTREQAIDYFRDNTPLSDGDVVTEVERFFVNPGQALSYKIGMNEILALRARAEEALGPRFDIRVFHDVVIGAGSLPLPLLERRVDAWIESNR